jgi:hypothetical protein
MTPISISILRLISALMMFCWVQTALAKSLEMKPIGELNGSQFHLVTSPQPPERVGKGAIFWIVQDEAGSSWLTATKYYVSCDARYISDSIDFEMSFEDSSADRKIEISQKLEKNNPSIRTSVVGFYDYESSELPFKSKIKNKIKDVCSIARPEKRGEQLPFFSSIFAKDNTNNISAFLPGTFSRKGDIVGGWVKEYGVTRSEIKKPNGEVLTNKAGRPYYRYDVNDNNYKMQKFVADCKDKKISVTSNQEYDKYGQVKSGGFSDIKPLYQDTIPDTKGEAVLTVFCSIY